jgi:hypothetical protein
LNVPLSSIFTFKEVVAGSAKFTNPKELTFGGTHVRTTSALLLEVVSFMGAVGGFIR